MARQQAQQGTSFLLSSHQELAPEALPGLQRLLLADAMLHRPA